MEFGPSEDISHILETWPHDPEDCLRIVELGPEERVIQVRLPMGLEQMEWDGRPDGLPDYFEQCEEGLEKHVQRNGSPRGFSLSEQDAEELIAEGILFYRRYLAFFQLGYMAETAKDTSRNLRLIDFLKEYADPKYAEQIEVYRPYILRMNVYARAVSYMEREDWLLAEEIVVEGIESIESAEEMEHTVYQLERTRSLSALRALLDQIREQRPPERSSLDRLRMQLRRAVEDQRFEDAAVIRDQIRALEGSVPE